MHACFFMLHADPMKGHDLILSLAERFPKTVFLIVVIGLSI